MIPGFETIEREIREIIVNELNRIGILYRIFSRTKDRFSIDEKITRKSKYKVGGELMQDVIGIRIVTYFKDDIEIIYHLLTSLFDVVEETIDNHELTVFKPKRTNIICRFNGNHSNIFNEVQLSMSKFNFDLIDNTFELQLRTMLSEGWHEIDHNLRYKCKKDWENHSDNERLLNGIYASLESNDYTLKSLTNELSYKHYQNRNWEGMIRTKFRLKFQIKPLSQELCEALNKNDLIKQIFKIDRNDVLRRICDSKLKIPVNFNNIVFLINYLYLKDENVLTITPDVLLEEFKYSIN